jgi:hypothetical protein
MFFTPTIVSVGVALLYSVAVLLSAVGDPLEFALIGTQFSQGDPAGTQGYDGQFAYQIALNPTGAAPYLDVPAYRYQRILYPLLARWAALAQPALIPWALLLVNLAAIGVGTWATERVLLHFKVSRWYALSYGLYGGQLLALRTDLNEPLAHGLVQLAALAWLKNKLWWAVAAFALAALAKETTLIFLAAFILAALFQRDWRTAIKLGLAGLPFLLWQVGLWRWLGAFGVGSGGAGATPFSLVPLGGWLAMLQVSVAAFLLVSLVVVPMSILPALAALVRSGRDLLTGSFHPFVLCLLLNSLMILFLPNSTFREPVAMLRLTQGLVASVLLYGALRRSRRMLNYSYFWIFTNVLLINGVAR